MRSMVYVATMHNTVYAFDADSPGPPIWQVNLGPSVPSWAYDSPNQPGPNKSYTDILPEIGILGTPVIDPASGTLYVVAATLEAGTFYYRLHALDTASGAEKSGAPVAISAQTQVSGDGDSPQTATFDAGQHIQRPALLLLNGVVYVAFGSHADTQPYHGWLIAYDATNVQNQTAVFNTTANGQGGSIWQAGRGPAADDEGHVYVVTSNGDTDNIANFSNTVLNLDPVTLAVTDWFTPSNALDLNDKDQDFGASGPVLAPGTNRLITGGKQGVLYMLDRTALGNTAPNDTQVPQSFPVASFGIFNMALWGRDDGPILYLQGGFSPLTAYKTNGGQFDTTASSQGTSQTTLPFQGMAVSADGSQAGTGIVWVTTPDQVRMPSPGTLRAYDASDLSQELWNSSANTADTLGTFAKFVSPTVANGKVYAATLSSQLVVYGLKIAERPPLPAMADSDQE